jgi:hypothetical protein
MIQCCKHSGLASQPFLHLSSSAGEACQTPELTPGTLLACGMQAQATGKVALAAGGSCAVKDLAKRPKPTMHVKFIGATMFVPGAGLRGLDLSQFAGSQPAGYCSAPQPWTGPNRSEGACFAPEAVLLLLNFARLRLNSRNIHAELSVRPGVCGVTSSQWSMKDTGVRQDAAAAARFRDG